MPKNITYILGAGASAGAIPTIKRLHLRMGFFFEILLAVSEKEGWEQNTDRIAKYRIILKEIKQFGTPDIVARTYHLKNEMEMERLVMEFLTCYMLFEQMEIPEEYLGEDEIKIIKDKAFGKDKDVDDLDRLDQTLDSRYVEFFSAILGKNESGIVKWPNNVKILSWNYDLQIVKSLSLFLSQLGQIEVERTFKVFPMTDVKPDGSEPISAIQPNIIKLNGTAGFLSSRGKSVMDSTYHKLNSDSWKIAYDVMFGRRYHDDIKNQLAFAWRENTLLKAAREKANQILKKSDVVVCIGYSFPNFNRQIDRSIFRGLNRDFSRIYIQDKYPYPVISKLDGVTGLPRERREAIDGTNSFYLPNEFWK